MSEDEKYKITAANELAYHETAQKTKYTKWLLVSSWPAFIIAVNIRKLLGSQVF